MKKNVFSLFCVVFMSMFCIAQSPRGSSISLGIGYGIDYGGLGGKISIKPVENFALVGGVGNYFGAPLSYATIDNYGRLTGKNLSGFGFSAGIEYFYGRSAAGGGLHYIMTGKYNGRKSVQGINWCVVGGDVYFNRIPLFIHYGFNLTMLFYNEEMGVMVGGSVGIGYSFDLSRSKKNVETKHLRNL